MKISLFLFLFFKICIFIEVTNPIWPKTRFYSLSEDSKIINIPFTHSYYLKYSKYNKLCSKNINYIFNHYKSIHFGKTSNNIYEFLRNSILNLKSNAPILQISIKNCSQSIDSDNSEDYTLELNENSLKLTAETYFGFVRGIDTYFQLLSPSKGLNSKLEVPVLIKDSPEYTYRGLMLDTARHFLTLTEILKTINGMMYSKLNVLHLHLTDSDSFPLELDSYPEMSQFGAFSSSEVYSKSNIKEIIK